MSVTQKHPYGSAIACVAFILGKTYDYAFTLFHDEKCHYEYSLSGHDPLIIIDALKRGGLNYTLKSDPSEKDSKQDNIIVCLDIKSTIGKYGSPHWHARTTGEWMNPWKNHPYITPAESGFETLPLKKIKYLIYPVIEPAPPITTSA